MSCDGLRSIPTTPTQDRGWLGLWLLAHCLAFAPASFLMILAHRLLTFSPLQSAFPTLTPWSLMVLPIILPWISSPLPSRLLSLNQTSKLHVPMGHHLHSSLFMSRADIYGLAFLITLSLKSRPLLPSSWPLCQVEACSRGPWSPYLCWGNGKGLRQDTWPRYMASNV